MDERVMNMYDATLVKTYQPVLPAGIGPICECAQYALRDIIEDICGKFEWTNYSNEDMDNLAQNFAHVIEDWIEGEHMVFFDDYKVVIKRYQRGYLDELPEFAGY